MISMTYQQRLHHFGDAIGALGGNVYHLRRGRLRPPCIVWQEEGSNDLRADGQLAESSPKGTMDYFTPAEFDPFVDAIQAKLDEIGAAWELLSIQYEQDTGLIHYEWSWEV